MQQPGPSPRDGEDVIKRACDQCRTRKIRCDKDSPCSNCRIAQRTCSTTGLGQKPKEPRQRVLISSQYEKKIDQFGIRLASIESAIRELTLALGNKKDVTAGVSSSIQTPDKPTAGPGSSSSTSLHFSPASVPNLVDDFDSDTSSDLGDSAYVGPSSLAAHTAQASEFLEHAVERERWTQQQPSENMRSALASLQQIVGLRQQKKKSGRLGPRRDVRFPNQKPIPPGGLRELPMPPAQVVIALLREIKDKPHITFTILYAFIDVEDFTHLCRRVYFATEDFSLATFIIVNACLYYLFQEKFIIMDKNDAGAAEYLEYHNMCRDNFETGLANLPFYIPPTMESIQSLLLGASYAIEMSKPSLAWQLNCAACQLCVSLGFHRPSPSTRTPTVQSQLQPAPSDTDPAAGEKSIIFWFGYILDKGLALRFGRPSVLQDYDIALPKSMPPTANMPSGSQMGDLTSHTWHEVPELWTGHAEIQGLVYEQLYSSAALRCSIESRVESARVLVTKLNGIAARTDALSDRLAQDPESQDENGNLGGLGPGSHDSALAGMSLSMVLKSDAVLHLSTLALIYRAIPPSEQGRPSRFNEECIAAARAAFFAHQECMSLTSSSQFLRMAYLHWTIMYAPFVPFIVIFCHVIETSDKDDLKRLEGFVASLEEARAVSRGVDKMHRLCRIMCDVATLYVEAKESEKQTQDTDMPLVENDFNMYLSQLGLMPPLQPELDAGLGAGALDGGGMMDASYQAAQLGDWFEGGRYMMGLLEEDLSQFQPEPGVWSSYVGHP